MTDTAPCSVERKCSSAGKMCFTDDRACQSEAIAGGLEIVCERPDALESHPSYVYCPPLRNGEQRDSGVVWILLAVAVAIAAAGGLASILVFRRRLKS
jgi:hypothetical protein